MILSSLFYWQTWVTRNYRWFWFTNAKRKIIIRYYQTGPKTKQYYLHILAVLVFLCSAVAVVVLAYPPICVTVTERAPSMH
uniref:Uncharacterized protein n=1 Tax=Oryza brachyantha TaxID=4533 RepID=J3MRP0_ORYBR